MSRCDSAAIVSKTRELLPEPETPVNAVNRRLGISRLTFLRLFSRAPWTRIIPWPSVPPVAGCAAVAGASALIPSSCVLIRRARSRPPALAGPGQRTSLIRTMFPAGSRTAQSRMPYGCSVGSWTTSTSPAWSRSKVASRSGVARTMMP